MMEPCLATVTNLALQGLPVIQLGDSVPAGSTSLVGNAQSVPRDTMASPTADVSEHLLHDNICIIEHVTEELKFLGYFNVV